MKTKWIWRNLVVSVALSCASLAAGDVVTDWNAAALNTIRTSSTAPPLPNTVRDFRGFLQAAREAALSRMYGGIHFSSANGDGLAVGLTIGAWTFKKTMRPR